MSRILVVDDELPILSGLSRALPEICNFFGEVRTVVNGREAVYEASNCFYDLCFLDIRLPDINGINVMQDIKEVSPQTEIILMSAHPTSCEVEKLVENNAAHYISKPFNFEQIKHLMKLSLDAPPHYFEKTSSRHGSEMRMHKRTELSTAVTFHVNGIHVRELGGTVNISYGGVCIETYYPLTRGEILIFEKGVRRKRGIVTWSAQKDNNNYRGGIKFL